MQVAFIFRPVSTCWPAASRPARVLASDHLRHLRHLRIDAACDQRSAAALTSASMRSRDARSSRRPDWITAWIFRVALMSFVGSASSNRRSASLPITTVPRDAVMPSSRADSRVPASSACFGDRPAATRLDKFSVQRGPQRQIAVEGVGARDDGDAGPMHRAYERDAGIGDRRVEGKIGIGGRRRLGLPALQPAIAHGLGHQRQRVGVGPVILRPGQQAIGPGQRRYGRDIVLAHRGEQSRRPSRIDRLDQPPLQLVSARPQRVAIGLRPRPPLSNRLHLRPQPRSRRATPTASTPRLPAMPATRARRCAAHRRPRQGAHALRAHGRRPAGPRRARHRAWPATDPR